MAEGIFNVVTEYIKEQDVSQKMKPSAVHEHGGKKRDDSKVNIFWCLEEDIDSPLRHNSERTHEPVNPGTQGDLKEKYEDIDPDESIAHKRDSPRSDVVS